MVSQAELGLDVPLGISGVGLCWSDAGAHGCLYSMEITVESVSGDGVQRCQHCSCGKWRSKCVRMEAFERWRSLKAWSLMVLHGMGCSCAGGGSGGSVGVGLGGGAWGWGCHGGGGAFVLPVKGGGVVHIA